MSGLHYSGARLRPVVLVVAGCALRRFLASPPAPINFGFWDTAADDDQIFSADGASKPANKWCCQRERLQSLQVTSPFILFLAVDNLFYLFCSGSLEQSGPPQLSPCFRLSKGSNCTLNTHVNVSNRPSLEDFFLVASSILETICKAAELAEIFEAHVILCVNRSSLVCLMQDRGSRRRLAEREWLWPTTGGGAILPPWAGGAKFDASQILMHRPVVMDTQCFSKNCVFSLNYGASDLVWVFIAVIRQSWKLRFEAFEVWNLLISKHSIFKCWYSIVIRNKALVL